MSDKIGVLRFIDRLYARRALVLLRGRRASLAPVARKGSTSELLAQETSAITTTESAETRIIDFFMAGTVVDAAGQFNRRTP